MYLIMRHYSCYGLRSLTKHFKFGTKSDFLAPAFGYSLIFIVFISLWPSGFSI